jgi:hypothetical protein
MRWHVTRGLAIGTPKQSDEEARTENDNYICAISTTYSGGNRHLPDAVQLLDCIRSSSAAARSSRRCAMDEVPGTERMLGSSISLRPRPPTGNGTLLCAIRRAMFRPSGGPLPGNCRATETRLYVRICSEMRSYQVEFVVGVRNTRFLRLVERAICKLAASRTFCKAIVRFHAPSLQFTILPCRNAPARWSMKARTTGGRPRRVVKTR